MTVLLNALCLFAFALNTSYYIAIILRFLTGFLQILMCVFGPVWVDRFAPEKYKSIYLTFLLLGTPLGVVFGYGLTFVCIKYLTWRWAYYIQLILAVPLAASFLCFSSDYTDVHKAIHEQEASLNRVRGNITGGTNEVLDESGFFSQIDN